MLRFQRETVCFSLVAYLLAASLGFGEWKLCVENAGELLLNPKCNQALECRRYSLSHCGPLHSPDTDAKPDSNCTCGDCRFCFKIPLVMVPSSRSTRLSQVSLTSSTDLRCPLCQTVSALLLCSGTYGQIPPVFPLVDPSFESLRSTILLI